jgi:hypothetical protein
MTTELSVREVAITLLLPEDQALALAQFVKRVGWSEISANSVDEEEAYVMRDAIGKVQRALAEIGFAPR